MQAAVTPDLNMQVELRHRESQQGDLAFNFDPAFSSIRTFSSIAFPKRGKARARVGVRYSPTPNSDVLLSYIHSDITDEVTSLPCFRLQPTCWARKSKGNTSTAVNGSISSPGCGTPDR